MGGEEVISCNAEGDPVHLRSVPPWSYVATIDAFMDS